VLGSLIELEVFLQLLRQNRTPRTVLGLVVLLLGGAIAAASPSDWHFTQLLQGEIIYQIGLSWCRIEWTYALTERLRTS
jgi:hypothetical protein